MMDEEKRFFEERLTVLEKHCARIRQGLSFQRFLIVSCFIAAFAIFAHYLG